MRVAVVVVVVVFAIFLAEGRLFPLKGGEKPPLPPIRTVPPPPLARSNSTCYSAALVLLGTGSEHRAAALCAMVDGVGGKPIVVVAILAKDKAHTLPHYLRALEVQTWPRNQTVLWIRSNNNNDTGTIDILRRWVAQHGSTYRYVHQDYTDVPERVERFGQHEWNAERFRVLGAIRQASVDFARHLGGRGRVVHYFVSDCDNLIAADTIEFMVATGKPVVGPLLRGTSQSPYYFNFHASIDANGYYVRDDREDGWVHGKNLGLFEVPVIHTSYLVRSEALRHVTYNDGTGRYEYVIFSHGMRKAGIGQWLDNTRLSWGCVTMGETAADLRKDAGYTECVRHLRVGEPISTPNK